MDHGKNTWRTKFSVKLCMLMRIKRTTKCFAFCAKNRKPAAANIHTLLPSCQFLFTTVLPSSKHSKPRKWQTIARLTQKGRWQPGDKADVGGFRQIRGEPARSFWQQWRGQNLSTGRSRRKNLLHLVWGRDSDHSSILKKSSDLYVGYFISNYFLGSYNFFQYVF